MTQSKYIKEIAKYGLENDQDRLLHALNELIDHSKKTRKTNFALQLQSLLKDSIRQQSSTGLAIHGSKKHISQEEDREINEFILEKLTSDYSFDNLVCTDNIKEELDYFVQEHRRIEILQEFNLPVSNKLLFHGPSGCGKTLAAYVLAGELNKLMIVINLGAIVSSKLGETSKNLSKIFKRAATEDCIIFLDEFDSLGKVRDFSQDHGEMKRVVNTILQLFDYLPQDNIIIAATNHADMIDTALMRRFDLQVNLELPDETHIKEIINKTLSNGIFEFDNKRNLSKIIKACQGLSYYTIQKSLITTIKRSLLSITADQKSKKPKIDTTLWISLIEKEQA
ncbi:AAA family ATPase [Labilibaculum euxinus]|uniref:AAA family ATPase n=1 Tax=Labilibaculum euxinus TaxID=2686357 RepID=A0A7M4DB79_9BACT|nr:ATP-binding protein [Labilibaculum euxinus]MUP39908.1 AAA family ATPase [Labilibaculum euxinus]MVB09113.1 AAA family ATPase [Labilibaculum euxinus]